MKVKTVIVFPNGSLSFCDKNLSSNIIINQYSFVKKSDKSFFFSEDKTIRSTVYTHFLKKHKKYFK
jgi:hypothetical protein